MAYSLGNQLIDLAQDSTRRDSLQSNDEYRRGLSRRADAQEARAKEKYEYEKEKRKRDEKIAEAKRLREIEIDKIRLQNATFTSDQNPITAGYAKNQEARSALASMQSANTFAYNTSQRAGNEEELGKVRAEEQKKRDRNETLFNQQSKVNEFAIVKADRDAQAAQVSADATFNKNTIMPQVIKSPHFDISNIEITNPIAFAKENSELAGDMFSQFRDYQFAMIDGKKVDIDVVGWDVTDTSVVPKIVIAETGQPVPPTVGGTNHPDDPIAALTHEQFGKMLNNQLDSVYENGGKNSDIVKNAVTKAENEGVLKPLAILEKNKKAKLRATIINEARDQARNGMGEPDSAKARMFGSIIAEETDLSELQRIAQTLGIDLAEITDSQDPSNQGTPLSRVFNASGERAVGRTQREIMSNLGFTKVSEFDLYKDLQRQTADVRKLGGRSAYRPFSKDQTPEELKTNTAAEKWYDKNTAALTRTMIKNASVKDKFEQMGAAEFFKTYATDTEGNPVDPKEIGSMITPPPFPLNRQTITDAINGVRQKSTPEQREQMLRALEERGLYNSEDIVRAIDERTLMEEDALAAVYVAASAEANPIDALAMIEPFINRIERGDSKIDVLTAQELDIARNANLLESKRQRTEAEEKAVTTELSQVEKANKTFDDRWITNTTDANGERKNPNSDDNKKYANLLRAPIARLNRAKSTEAKRAILTSINPVLSYILQGEAAREPGWLEWVGQFIKVGEKEVEEGQASDFNLDYVQNGDDASLVYAPPGGQTGRYVPIEVLKKLDDKIYKLLQMAADLNSEL